MCVGIVNVHAVPSLASGGCLISCNWSTGGCNHLTGVLEFSIKAIPTLKP